jgi:large subunit ribosomal protein L13
VNAEKVVISGNKNDIMKRYKEKRGRKDVANPRKGPMFPKTPDGIVLRTIRGMINYRSARGTRALKNLRVFIGVPEKYSKSKLNTIKEADSKKLQGKITTVGSVSNELGYAW